MLISVGFRARVRVTARGRPDPVAVASMLAVPRIQCLHRTVGQQAQHWPE